MLTPQISPHLVDKAELFIAYDDDREGHLHRRNSVWGGKAKPDFLENLNLVSNGSLSVVI